MTIIYYDPALPIMVMHYDGALPMMVMYYDHALPMMAMYYDYLCAWSNDIVQVTPLFVSYIVRGIRTCINSSAKALNVWHRPKFCLFFEFMFRAELPTTAKMFPQAVFSTTSHFPPLLLFLRFYTKPTAARHSNLQRPIRRNSQRNCDQIWQKFEKLWQLNDGLFCFGQNFKPNLAKIHMLLGKVSLL